MSSNPVLLDLSDSASLYGYSTGTLEATRMFTWKNVEGSTVDVTLQISGVQNVNDFLTSGLRIGKNEGVATGAQHVYTFTFSEAIEDLFLPILNVNMGDDFGFTWNDQLVFSGSPTFTQLSGGVTASGNTINPAFGSSDNQFVTAYYSGPTSKISIVHGLGGDDSFDPGYLVFPVVQFAAPESSYSNAQLYVDMAKLSLASYKDFSFSRQKILDGVFWDPAPLQSGPSQLPLGATFSNGLYSYRGASLLVLEATYNGERTVTLAFRGTDQLGDIVDYPDFSDHYEKLRPIISHAIDHILHPETNVSTVFVTGHSLGGAMAQSFILENQPVLSENGKLVRGMTFGSPGSDTIDIPESLPDNLNLLNFRHTEDPITYSPFLGRLLELTVVGTAVALRPDQIRAILTIAKDIEQKSHVGESILMTSGKKPLLDGIFSEHSLDLYLDTLERSLMLEEDVADGSDGRRYFADEDGSFMVGLNGADSLYGGSGADWLISGLGGDLANGDAGDDRLWGMVGADSLYGGEGDDSIYGNLGDDVLEGGRGDDILRGHLGQDVLRGGDGNDSLIGGASGDTAIGGAGNDTMSGSSGDDLMEGGDGHDLVRGQAGSDTIMGGSGNDTLFGIGANDVLYGGDGADTLTGGQANDTMTGGSGRDVFQFGRFHGADVITDFIPDVDKISLVASSVGVTQFSDLAIRNSNDGAVITFESFVTTQITLSGNSANQLDAGDFFLS